MTDAAATCDGLRKHFPVARRRCSARARRVHAVDGVSFAIARAKHWAWSANPAAARPRSGRCILRADRADRRRDLVRGPRPRRSSHGDGCARCAASMQMVFQDPFASLNPRMTVGAASSAEPLMIHRLATAARERSDRVGGAAGTGRAAPRPHSHAIPHEFSGGQRQRIGIARALALQPAVDRVPTNRSPRSTFRSRRRSSTCCSDLQDELGLTYLFIAHDLAVVRAYQRPRRGDVSRPHRRNRARRRAVRRPRAIPTPRRCCQRCRSPIRR